MDGVLGVTCSALRDGVTEAVIEIDDEFKGKITEKLFYAFARLNKPILHMAENQVSLEEVFLELTSQADISTAEETLPGDDAKGRM